MAYNTFKNNFYSYVKDSSETKATEIMCCTSVGLGQD